MRPTILYSQNPQNKQLKKKKSVYLKRLEMLFCEKCKCVWETVYDSKIKPYIIYKRDVLPSYGKIRKICPECLKKEEEI